MIDRKLLFRIEQLLDELRGNVNPERDCVEELEAEILITRDQLRAALDAPQQEAVAWYCDNHGYTDNKDDAESWRCRGMPVTEYYLHPAPSVPQQSGFVSGGYKQLGDFRPPSAEAPQQEATCDSINAARAILTYLDYSIAPSREPGADDRVDAVADIIATRPLNTHPAPSVPEGWQLVPKEPTQDMQQTFIDTYLTFGFASAYRDMLSAARTTELIWR